jgi:hypothetical protein
MFFKLLEMKPQDELLHWLSLFPPPSDERKTEIYKRFINQSINGFLI